MRLGKRVFSVDIGHEEGGPDLRKVLTSVKSSHESREGLSSKALLGKRGRHPVRLGTSVVSGDSEEGAFSRFGRRQPVKIPSSRSHEQVGEVSHGPRSAWGSGRRGARCGSADWPSSAYRRSTSATRRVWRAC